MIPITSTTTFLDNIQAKAYSYLRNLGSDLKDRIFDIWVKTEKFRTSILSTYENAKPILIDSFIWLKIKTLPLQLKVIKYAQLDFIKNLVIATVSAAAGAFIFCICSPFAGGLYGTLFYAITKGLFRLVTHLEIDKKINSYLCYSIVLSVGYLITSAIIIHLIQCQITFLLGIPLAVISCLPYILPYIIEESNVK